MAGQDRSNDQLAIRSALRQIRRRLSADRSAAAAAASAAADRFVAAFAVTGAPRLGLYRAHDGELDPLPLERTAAVLGATVFLPVITDATLEFAALTEGSDLRTNSFGIDEPADAATVVPDQLDLVVMPLVGFDRRGHRLGHGHGYYDRAFSFRLDRGAPPLLIGYAWDEQEVDAVADHEADVPLDAIVTPTRVIRPTRPSEPPTDGSGAG